MALLLAQARNVPQAHAALDRRPLGAGAVGGRRARRQDARHRRPRPDRQARRRPRQGVPDAARRLRPVRLGRPRPPDGRRADAARPGRRRPADFLTIHLPKTKETTGLIDRELLLKAKPTLRVINVARGGIVVEADLAECIRDGVIAGAALDVFDHEPTTESPLFELDQVVVTPHLGASTREAQDKAGDAIADMVQLALAGDFVPWAVNVDAAEANEAIRPFLPLAERLGRLYGSLHRSSPDSFELCCQGDIARYDTRILGLAVLKGFFSRISDGPVSYVNAPSLAKAAGIAMREVNSHRDRRVRQPDHAALPRPPQHQRHAHRPPRRAADRRDRRPRLRRAARRAHAGRHQRRPSRRDRLGRSRCSATPTSTSPTWTSAGSPTPARP